LVYEWILNALYESLNTITEQLYNRAA